jgi:hypothetical protein
VTQLRQVPAAEGSEKSAIEDYQYIFLVGEIGKRHDLSVKIRQGKRWRGGVEDNSGHV